MFAAVTLRWRAGLLLLERACAAGGSNYLKDVGGLFAQLKLLRMVTWCAELTASTRQCLYSVAAVRVSVAMCRQHRVACTEGDAPGLRSTPSPSRPRS